MGWTRLKMAAPFFGEGGRRGKTSSAVLAPALRVPTVTVFSVCTEFTATREVLMFADIIVLEILLECVWILGIGWFFVGGTAILIYFLFWHSLVG